MNQVNILRRNGVFDSKAPRYTSYPPANRFELGVGARHQRAWMGAVSPAVPVSLYVHIPFCRRLCWFCACRTQGTKTLAPVEKYIDTLVREIAAVAGQHLPPGLRMGRLHLGGGTPTLLSEALMTRLLDALWSGFTRDEEFEFSVEIDPTDAAPEVLDAMMRRNLDRASIGVQDFEPRVQAAIGRVQSFEDTQAVVARLRQGGVRSLNIDLLYGLPYQTEDSLRHTLQHVIALRPDRLALYGYAHVPHISKRQVMIPDAALPGGVERFAMSQMARDHLVAEGFVDIGIDHFARPEDRLAVAARAGTLTRNFQGYTDDTCETLIGLGASAISKFAQGYVQNAVSTSAYTGRVLSDGVAGHKGFALSHTDRFLAALIDGVLCQGAINADGILTRFPGHKAELQTVFATLQTRFPDLVDLRGGTLAIKPGLMACARVIASHLDRTLLDPHHHSIAV